MELPNVLCGLLTFGGALVLALLRLSKGAEGSGGARRHGGGMMIGIVKEGAHEEGGWVTLFLCVSWRMNESWISQRRVNKQLVKLKKCDRLLPVALPGDLSAHAVFT